jgi:menaquinone-dependent protoporphyrinogen oxidase
MDVLVVFASRAGATAEIAERIGERVARTGHHVVVRPVTESVDPARHDAVVLGSAVYMGHWLKDATAFARRNRVALAERPLWLFSSGPLGVEQVDDEGRDLREVSAPEELPELLETLSPRDHRVFFGALDPRRLSLAHRSLRKLPAGRRILPEGDFRDWREVDSWATGIATQLAAGT